MNIACWSWRSLAVCGITLGAASVVAEEKVGFFGGVDAGGTITESTSLKEFPDAPPGGDVEFHPGGRLGFNIGYRFEEWVSLSLESGVMACKLKGTDISFSQIPVMMNVEFSVPNRSRFEPFVGGGPGFSASQVYAYDDRLSTGSDVDGGAIDVIFAWQVYGGLRYNFDERMSFGLVYKYFAADETEWDVSGTTQDIRFGSTRTHSVSVLFQARF